MTTTARGFGRHSIQWKLPAAISILLAAAAVLVLILGYYRVRSLAIVTADERLEAVMGLLGRTMDQQFQGRARAAHLQTTTNPIQRYFHRPTARGFVTLAATLHTSLADSSIAAIELVGRSGRRLGTVPRTTPRLPTADSAQLAAAVATPDSAGTLPLTLVDSTMMYGTAALVAASGAPAGYVVTWRRLRPNPQARQSTAALIGSEAELFLGSPDGVWTDQERVVSGPPPAVTAATHPEWYQRDGAGRRLGLAGRVDASPWYILIEFPESAVLGPAQTLLRQMALIAIVVIVIGMIAAWMFSHRLVTPILDLTDAVDVMATGTHQVRVPVQPAPAADEIGVLATAFNRMAERVDEEVAGRAASERQWRLLFDANPHAMWVRDPTTHRFLAVNDAALAQYGWSRDEMLALPAEAMEVDDPTPVAPSSPEGRLVSRHRRRDGTIIDVELHEQPTIFEGHGATLFLAQNVTDRRALEAQLRQAQKMEAIGRLAGGVAHDFNNLLLVIKGFGEMVRDTLSADDPRHPQLTEVLAAADRGRGLTGQLLAFSRRQVLQTTVFDPNAAVRNVEGMVRRLIGEDVAVNLELIPGIGAIRADPNQFEQIVLNLAVNARDAMPQGGRLTFRTRLVDVDEGSQALHGLDRTGRHVMLSVADTGVGMTPEVRARVFEPFFTTKEPGKGTGLGLATVYGIVAQANGGISVYSEPGHGTTFHIYFPQVQATAPATAVPVAAPRGGDETILLVEDEPAVRAVAAAMLGRLGYHVIVATHADEALLLANQPGVAIDLVLSDVVMPGLDGPALIRKLRERWPDLRAVLMSGYTGDAVTSRGLAESGDPIIQKPFTNAGLADQLRRLLDRR